MPDQDEANAALLDGAEKRGWFPARKTAGLWARQLERPQTVQTLEGPTQAGVGDYLCRGPQGEMWPQAAQTLLDKYVPTDEIDAEGFRRWKPDPEKSRVMATQMTVASEVVTPWGRLQAAAGDYVVKGWADRDNPRPADVWPVAREVFESGYERLEREPGNEDGEVR